MGELIFILLFIICIGFIYVVHKYFGKHEFYLLTVIYSVISFILSFKLVNILSLNINLGIIFSSGLLLILYYFVNRFGKEEIKKFITVVMISTIIPIILVIISSIMIPSIYDEVLVLFQTLVFDNIAILILYPVGLFMTLLLASYSFKELKLVEKKKEFKTILTLAGIVFIDVFVFMYFSYAIIIKFNDALLISLDNYFVKVIIVIVYYLCINKIIKVKKVKS